MGIVGVARRLHPFKPRKNQVRATGGEKSEQWKIQENVNFLGFMGSQIF